MTQWIVALVVIASAVVAGFWMGYPIPAWAIVAFACVLLVAAVPLTVKRMRTEYRLVRSLWNALTGK